MATTYLPHHIIRFNVKTCAIRFSKICHLCQHLQYDSGVHCVRIKSAATATAK